MKRERPVILLVAGILAILLGGFGVVCGGCGAGVNFWLYNTAEKAASSSGSNPARDILDTLAREAPGYKYVEIGKPVIGLLLGLFLIIAGIGLIMVQPWAKWLTVFYSIVTIFLNIGYFGYEVGVVMPAVKKWQESQPYFVETQGQFAKSMIGPGLLTGFFVITSLALLVVLFLPGVNAAFRGEPIRRRDYQDQGW